MKTLRVDYGASENRLTVPAGVGMQLAPVVVGDLYELQLLATRDGIPIDLTVWTNYGLFIFKTFDQLIGGGDFTDAFIGFNTSSSFWLPAAGQIAIGFALDTALAGNNLYAGVVLFNSGGDRWTTGDQALVVPTQFALYVGTEPSKPQGVPGGVRGSWHITGTTPYVDIAVPGATSNTNLNLSSRPSTGGAGDPGMIAQVALGGGADTVRIVVGSAPGTGAAFNGTYILEHL